MECVYCVHSFVEEFTSEFNEGPTQLFIASLVQVWEESLDVYLAQFMVLILFASCSVTQLNHNF